MASRAHVREASKKSFGCPSPTKDESNLCDRHAVGGIIHEPGAIVEHVPIQLLKVVLNSIYQGGGVINRRLGKGQCKTLHVYFDRLQDVHQETKDNFT